MFRAAGRGAFAAGCWTGQGWFAKAGSPSIPPGRGAGSEAALMGV